MLVVFALCQFCSFNPRPREGGDPKTLMPRWFWACFNPRPREGGDDYAFGAGINGGTFQSTPP